MARGWFVLNGRHREMGKDEKGNEIELKIDISHKIADVHTPNRIPASIKIIQPKHGL